MHHVVHSSLRSRVAALLVIASASGVNAQPILLDPSLAVETVLTGLSQPITMAFLPPPSPGDIHFLVLQRANGQVRRVLNGTIQTPDPVLDLHVNSNSERGLLGIAISQDDPPDVFLFLTERSAGDGTDAQVEGNRVYRYTWNQGAGTLDNPLLVLDLAALPGPNHNGGVLALDDESPQHLYALIGDLNLSGQLQNSASGAPDDSSVIFRVDRDGQALLDNPLSPYCSNNAAVACTANVDCGAGTCHLQVARYFAYGIRNGFGLAFDPVTGDLWDTENGPGSPAFDEVNRVAPGFNSGWRDEMGPADGGTNGGGSLPLFVIPGSAYSDPEFSWRSAVAPTAIVFPAGGDLGPIYDDAAVVGDNNGGRLYRLPLNSARTGFDLSAASGLADLVADNDTERDAVRFGTGFGVVTDLEMGPDGNLYVVNLNGGAIYRIVRPARDFFTVSPCRLVDTRLVGGALSSGIDRIVTVAGSCGVPTTARAVSLNVTAISASQAGSITVWAENLSMPGTTNGSFAAGQTRAVQAIAALATDGDGTIRARATLTTAGTVHLVLDVNGYFE